MLRPVRTLSAASLFPAVLIGYAWTAILPLQMGELVRAYVAGRQYQLPYSLVLSSIGLERIIDLLTIMILLGIALVVGEKLPDFAVKAGYVVTFISLMALAMASIFATRTQQSIAFATRLFSVLPDRIIASVEMHLASAARGVRSLVSPTLILRAIANSLMQWTLMGVCIWLSLIALDIEVPITGAIIVLVATIIGISLPTSPGYIGNIQLAFVVSLEAYGVSAEKAVASSIYYHFLAYVSVVSVGFACQYRLGYKAAEIRSSGVDSGLAHRQSGHD